MDLLQYLQKEYGVNNPIYLNELTIKGMRKDALRQSLSRLVKEGKLARCMRGVYYIPTMTIFGPSLISSFEIYEKKYMTNGKETYGFYSGLYFQNMIGMTSQVPSIREITTNMEKTRLRTVTINGMPLRLRSSRVQITKENAGVLQLLELMNQIEWNTLSDYRKNTVVNFALSQGIREENVYKYIGSYPAKTARTLLESGILNELRDKSGIVRRDTEKN